MCHIAKYHKNPVFKRYAGIVNGTFLSGVATTLERDSIRPSTISIVILGHTHFDHIGDFASIPLASLVLGPGFTPSNAELADELDIPISVLEEHTVRILSRTGDRWSVIGCLDGFD